MRSLPDRNFDSKFDKILKKIPLIGKGFSSLFGLIEVQMLEIFRKFDSKFNMSTINIVNKYFFRGRWGGKVIPLNINLNPETRFLPSQEILSILERSNVVGIAKCYCRETQRRYSSKVNCEHPLNTCIHLGTGKSLYDIPYKSNNLKRVSKEDIEKLLKDCDNQGLVHQIIYFPNPQFYYVVCNCCPCCCVVMNKFLGGGSPQIIKSEFIAITNAKMCINCGNCSNHCHFGARKIEEEVLIFDPKRCFGCGICVSKCPQNAISLTFKANKEKFLTEVKFNVQNRKIIN